MKTSCVMSVCALMRCVADFSVTPEMSLKREDGMFAHLRRGSEDFARAKQEEIELEERKLRR